MKKTLRMTEPAGMNPKMTVPKKPKKRKPPNPYKAPMSVKRYYSGLEDGIRLLEKDLYANLEDKSFITQEELMQLIKERAARNVQTQKVKLIALEKEKTKKKIKEWEEKEWESI